MDNMGRNSAKLNPDEGVNLDDQHDLSEKQDYNKSRDEDKKSLPPDVKVDSKNQSNISIDIKQKVNFLDQSSSLVTNQKPLLNMPYLTKNNSLSISKEHETITNPQNKTSANYSDRPSAFSIGNPSSINPGQRAIIKGEGSTQTVHRQQSQNNPPYNQYYPNNLSTQSNSNPKNSPYQNYYKEQNYQTKIDRVKTSILFVNKFKCNIHGKFVLKTFEKGFWIDGEKECEEAEKIFEQDEIEIYSLDHTHIAKDPEIGLDAKINIVSNNGKIETKTIKDLLPRKKITSTNQKLFLFELKLNQSQYFEPQEKVTTFMIFMKYFKFFNDFKSIEELVFQFKKECCYAIQSVPKTIEIFLLLQNIYSDDSLLKEYLRNTLEIIELSNYKAIEKIYLGFSNRVLHALKEKNYDNLWSEKLNVISCLMKINMIFGSDNLWFEITQTSPRKLEILSMLLPINDHINQFVNPSEVIENLILLILSFPKIQSNLINNIPLAELNTENRIKLATRFFNENKEIKIDNPHPSQNQKGYTYYGYVGDSSYNNNQSGYCYISSNYGQITVKQNNSLICMKTESFILLKKIMAYSCFG